eukprot:CAMPEP_0119281904 /NCGR_PEP_ID=MMETSP1329-20130426/25741_1 /TAXON_ID=114041 /ORGANISM="Genus nov. species nov., Strain RCC1024" /LENGTH=327 /DNA_ID=CAMNT_0007282543 /DNA_START=82 /DNA_END=1062 /DNA_ORIENTATION=-
MTSPTSVMEAGLEARVEGAISTEVADALRALTNRPRIDADAVSAARQHARPHSPAGETAARRYDAAPRGRDPLLPPARRSSRPPDASAPESAGIIAFSDRHSVNGLAPQCPICLKGFESNAPPVSVICCCSVVCERCFTTLCRRGLEQGHFSPCPLCGEDYPSDNETNLRRLQEHVNAERPLGFFIMGELYAEGGLGLEPSPRRAVRMYRRAAKAGVARAATKLALILLEGQRGVRQDHAEGYAWARKAADAGDAFGQYVVGIFAPAFLSNEEAAGFWKRAAEQGLACAALSLAWATERGTYGFAPNRAQAALWYARAAEGGSEEAA